MRIPPSDRWFTRRSFLRIGAGLAGSSLFTSARSDEKLMLPRGVPRSRVALARSRNVLDGPVVHRQLLTEMLDASLIALVPAAMSAGDAWRAILKHNDVVGIKFNRSGQAVIGTSPVVADVLVRSLIHAGWPPNQIVCIEAPAGVESVEATLPARAGFDAHETDFGSGSDQFSAVLGQITALIDVPFLKNHNIAGMTASLKNLSHGLIKHPARYHGHGCSPYIADIVAAEPIRRKLRLCVVDGLRAVYDRGPDPTAETISDEGILLTGFDPVAIDTVGLGLLDQIRSRHGLPTIARPGDTIPYLAAAHRRELGIALPHGIDVLTIET